MARLAQVNISISVESDSFGCQRIANLRLGRPNHSELSILKTVTNVSRIMPALNFLTQPRTNYLSIDIFEEKERKKERKREITNELEYLVHTIKYMRFFCFCLLFCFLLILGVLIRAMN